MKETKELIVVNNNSIFYKIKKWFRSLFHKKEKYNNQQDTIETTHINSLETQIKEEKQNNSFITELKEKTQSFYDLKNIQKEYDKGNIETKKLSKEQVLNLKQLYKEQISELKIKNRNLKKQLVKYDNILKTVKNSI